MRAWWIVLVLLSLPFAVSSAEESQEAQPFREDVLVERVHWPVVFENKTVSRGRCDSMRPEHIALREDGQQVEVTRIDRRSLSSLHILMLDTSGSMVSRFDRAKEAAKQYARATVPQEPVMVVSFDGAFVLHTRPSTNLMEISHAIDGIRLGRQTAMWSSMYQLARYVDSIPGRKVIVLLGDGLDSHGHKRYTFERVSWFLGSIANLTIYPVGLQIPNERGFVSVLARPEMTELAEVTGGEFLIAESESEIGDNFQSIRQALDLKQFLSYVPHAFGRGKRDDKDGLPYRLRRVTVKATGTAPCNVRSAGPRVRFSGRRFEAADFLEVVEPTAADAERAGRLAAMDPKLGTLRATSSMQLPSHWQPLALGSGEPASLQSTTKHDVLMGRVQDVIYETGELYDPESSEGLAARSIDRSARAMRDILVEVPTLHEMKAESDEPLDLFESFLSSTAHVPHDTKPPHVVNGQSIFDLRPYLAQALFLERADLRTWAVTKIERQLRLDLADLKSDLEEDDPLREVIERLEFDVGDRAKSPTPDQPQRYLMEWIGDHQIADLAGELDRKWSRRALAGDRSFEDRAATWMQIWNRYALADSDRVVAWLRLSYDRERDRFGFHRFVLPGQRVNRMPKREVPRHPVSWLFSRWAHQNDVLDSSWSLANLELIQLDGALRDAFSAMLQKQGQLEEGALLSRTEMTFAKLNFASSNGKEVEFEVGFRSGHSALSSAPFCVRTSSRRALRDADRSALSDLPSCPLRLESP